MSVFLSAYIYFYIDLIVSVVGKDGFKYWEELEVEAEVGHTHKRDTYPAVVLGGKLGLLEAGFLAQEVQWTVTKGQV